jgi:hypothetical protein
VCELRERGVLDPENHDELVRDVALRVEVRVPESGVDEAVDHDVPVEGVRHDLLVLRGVGVEDVRDVGLALVRDDLPRLLREAAGDRLRVVAGLGGVAVHARRIGAPTVLAIVRATSDERRN